MDGPGKIVVCGLECFKSCAARVIYPLESELAASPFLYLFQNPAAAFDTSGAKFVHYFFPPSFVCDGRPSGTTKAARKEAARF